MGKLFRRETRFFYANLDTGTRLDIRLGENYVPRRGEEPTSETDALALKHDISYRNADALNDKAAVLAAKQQADKEIINGIDKAEASGLFDCLQKRAPQAALWAKLKAGAGASENINGISGSSSKANKLKLLKVARCIFQ